MTDPRYNKLASLLVHYSAALKKGDRILLDMIDVPDEFTVALIRAVRAAGAIPFVETRHGRVAREQLMGVTEAQAVEIRDIEMFRMKKMQAYIALRGSYNVTENADVPGDKMQMYAKVIRPLQDYRINKTRWVVLRWPTPGVLLGNRARSPASRRSVIRGCRPHRRRPRMEFLRHGHIGCRKPNPQRGCSLPLQRQGVCSPQLRCRDSVLDEQRQKRKPSHRRHVLPESGVRNDGARLRSCL